MLPRKQMSYLGALATQRAWSRAGAIAEVLATHPIRRALSLGTRIALLLSGSITIACAVALMLWNNFGPGPLDVFIGALRNITGLPLMIAVWLTTALLLVAAWVLGRRPGPGTLLAPLVIGPVMQAVLALLKRIDAPDQLVVHVAVHLLAVGMAGIGAGALIVARLGAGTGELLAAAASDRSGRPEPRVRLAFEVAFLVIGVVLGGPVGLGTVIVALGIGPAVANGHRIVDSAVTASRRQLSDLRFALAA